MNSKKYLKEDGSLDVERINKLPIEEYIKVVGAFTQEQYRYYTSKLPINESHEPTKPVVFYPLEELLERGLGVDAEEYLKKKREKYGLR